MQNNRRPDAVSSYIGIAQHQRCRNILQQAKEQELQRWSTDKLLSKAVQFADEELASELSIDKEFIETRYEEAIQQAT